MLALNWPAKPHHKPDGLEYRYRGEEPPHHVRWSWALVLAKHPQRRRGRYIWEGVHSLNETEPRACADATAKARRSLAHLAVSRVLLASAGSQGTSSMPRAVFIAADPPGLQAGAWVAAGDKSERGWH